MPDALSKKELKAIDAYWRAANYLASDSSEYVKDLSSLTLLKVSA